MELRQLSGNIYYIPHTTNIGVIKDGNEAILIDSGVDDEMGAGILKLLDEHGLTPKAIVNTHSHPDHFGGNAYIRQQTGALVYAPEVEAAMIQYPYMEPFYLFSGASPIRDLKGKYIMAPPSPVDYIIGQKERVVTIGNVEIKVVPLPGHSVNHIGLEVDGILFCADTVLAEEALPKLKVPICMDICLHRETLSLLRNSSYSLYVPSHAAPTKRIARLVDAYMELISGIEELVFQTAKDGKTMEQVLKEVCDTYKIEMNSAQHYYIMNTSIMAYLSALHEQERLKFEIKGNSLYWGCT